MKLSLASSRRPPRNKFQGYKTAPDKSGLGAKKLDLSSAVL